jgi:hypothetical protein
VADQVHDPTDHHYLDQDQSDVNYGPLEQKKRYEFAHTPRDGIFLVDNFFSRSLAKHNTVSSCSI